MGMVRGVHVGDLIVVLVVLALISALDVPAHVASAFVPTGKRIATCRVWSPIRVLCISGEHNGDTRRLLGPSDQQQQDEDAIPKRRRLGGRVRDALSAAAKHPKRTIGAALSFLAIWSAGCRGVQVSLTPPVSHATAIWTGVETTSFIIEVPPKGDEEPKLATTKLEDPGGKLCEDDEPPPSRAKCITATCMKGGVVIGVAAVGAVGGKYLLIGSDKKKKNEDDYSKYKEIMSTEGTSEVDKSRIRLKMTHVVLAAKDEKLDAKDAKAKKKARRGDAGTAIFSPVKPKPTEMERLEKVAAEAKQAAEKAAAHAIEEKCSAEGAEKKYIDWHQKRLAAERDAVEKEVRAREMTETAATAPGMIDRTAQKESSKAAAVAKKYAEEAKRAADKARRAWIAKKDRAQQSAETATTAIKDRVAAQSAVKAAEAAEREELKRIARDEAKAKAEKAKHAAREARKAGEEKQRFVLAERVKKEARMMEEERKARAVKRKEDGKEVTIEIVDEVKDEET